MDTINETPGISQAEIAYVFEKDRRDVSYNVNVLVNKDLVRMHKVKGKTFLYVENDSVNGDEEKGFDKVTKEHENELEELENEEDEVE